MGAVSHRPGRPHLVFLLLLLCAGFNQVWVGAMSSGLGGFEDEPAHVVTALMIRDWVATGASDPSVWCEPRAFAESYYVHYPKVGIGQWPPVFHGLLGAWMLVFGSSKLAIVALLTIFTAALGTLVAVILRPALGATSGLLAGLVLLSVPIVQLCGASAMTEIPLALFALAAVASFGRFMDSGQARWVWMFAAAATATVLTKGSGLALALVPPFALVLAGRWDLFRRPVLWAAGAGVGLVTAPWYILTVGLTQGSWGGGTSPSWAYVKFAASEYSGWALALTGPLGVLLVLAGIVWSLRQSRDGARHAGLWVSLVAWVPALLVLHHVVPSSVEERHLSVLAPAWVALGALGAAALARAVSARVGAGAGSRANALAVALLGVSGLLWNGAPPKKAFVGWDIAGARFAEGMSGGLNRVLIASDPVGEGLFVAGAALADEPRPGLMVLRASKVLCDAGWSGRTYSQRFETAAELDAWLTGMGVAALVVDLSTRDTRHWYGHMQQLVDIADTAGAGWTEVERWDLVRGADRHSAALVAYVREGWEQLPAPSLELRDVRPPTTEQ